MASARRVDRISNLPRGILDLILERLPLHDAARTTTLSKTWRNIWVTQLHLVFDDEFVSRLISKIEEEDQQYKIVTTISNILLRHRGPIFKFHLSIPGEIISLNHTASLDSWIENIANNRIRMLEIFNNPLFVYKLPSYLFSCVELTHLHLSNCTLNAPCNFRGFPNLISVELSGVVFTADMSFGSQLQTLDLRQCTGIKHLGCQFTYNSNLSKLIIDSEDQFSWRWSVGNGRVIRSRSAADSWKCPIFLYKLLGNIPRIHFLCLDGYFFKFLEPDWAILIRPITTMDNLRTLHLVRVGFHDLVQVQYVLCLIRSSPNLRRLSIKLEPKVIKLRDGMESSIANKVEQYLRLPNLVDMILDKLESVNILGIVGSRHELHFIKFLLASCTSLKWMKLSKSDAIDNPKEELRIIREVKGLHRASTRAQITWN